MRLCGILGKLSILLFLFFWGTKLDEILHVEYHTTVPIAIHVFIVVSNPVLLVGLGYSPP